MPRLSPRQDTAEARSQNLIASGQRVIEIEQQAVAALIERLDDRFLRACELMLGCKGRIVVTGIGKSGHVAGKIAATLASTGTPAFYVHPGDAGHGDLGMITRDDLVLALSNSGDSPELLTILPFLKRQGIPLIALTGNPNSALARQAEVILDTSVTEEACPLGLAPTSSTTASLVMGDALAVALLEAKGFTREDFAFSHPSGSLGRQLLLRVSDIMHTGDAIPAVAKETSLLEAVLEISAKKLGMTAVIDPSGLILGIFTDGDLRRLLERTDDIRSIPIAEVMKTGCTTAPSDMLAAEALRIMEDRRINALLVTDESHRLVGALNMHDLLRAGIV